MKHVPTDTDPMERAKISKIQFAENFIFLFLSVSPEMAAEIFTFY